MSKYVSARFGMLFALLLLSIFATAAPLKIVGFDDMSCRAWMQSKVRALPATAMASHGWQNVSRLRRTALPLAAAQGHAANR